MSVGYQAQNTVNGLNASLGQIAVNLRNDCQIALNFFENVNALGVAGLQGIGFSAADAQAFFNAANYLQTVAQVYFGTAAQTPAFNFDTALAAARGGQ